MSWFANWFDSKYYHMLYKNRDLNEAKLFVKNLISKLNFNEGKILDVACGKGRHARLFNQLGFNVVGIDLSLNSINEAKIFENNKLKFFQFDMRKEFANEEFNIVTNLFTSFGYFDDLKDEQRTFNSIQKGLKKDGLLIIDFLNSQKTIANLVKNEVKEINGVSFKIDRFLKDKYLIKNILISDNGQKHQFQEKVHALSLADFTKLINNAGMKIINIFGNYHLENFEAKKSDRLIIIAKK